MCYWQSCDFLSDKLGTDSGGFWVRRWLLLKDDTSTLPICLQLYRVAQVSWVFFSTYYQVRLS